MMKKNVKMKGIALVEILVSLAVFSILVASMMSVFTTLLRQRTEVKQSQQRTEELSLTTNYVAKKMRMSNLKTCSPSSCTVTDNATGADVTFSFNGNNLQENGTTVVSDVAGGFSAISSSGVPRIMIYLMRTGKPETSVQTTVSLRNY